MIIGMLTHDERHIIYQQAYLPEHLPDYVEAVSGATPFLIDNFMCFQRRRHLIFIGYPLGDENADLQKTYAAACQKFKPATIAMIAPKNWIPEENHQNQTPDFYYRLNIPMGAMTSANAYMLRRAARQLIFQTAPFNKDHKKLIQL